MEGNGKGNTVLLTVIGVSTLLVALVGATFAYFTASLNVVSTQSVTVVTATPVGLTYEGSNTISIENAIPGMSDNADFTVLNPASEDGTAGYPQTYDLDLVIDSNGFENTDSSDEDTDTDDGQLLIAITPSTDGANNPADGTTGKLSDTFKNGTLDVTAGYTTTTKIVDDQRIAVGEKHTYNLAITFVELSKEQNLNQGKEFTAHVEISNPQTINE